MVCLEQETAARRPEGEKAPPARQTGFPDAFAAHPLLLFPQTHHSHECPGPDFRSHWVVEESGAQELRQARLPADLKGQQPVCRWAGATRGRPAVPRVASFFF